MRRLVAVLVALGALVSAPACRDETVRIAFEPPQGARYAYHVRVTSTAVTRIAGQPAQRSVDRSTLDARHLVLGVGRDRIQVEVRLTDHEGSTRTFIVRLDRAGQLAEVQRIEGLPAQALGELGLSEIFPAAAGAPPPRPLAPGDRWTIDEPLRVDDTVGGRVRGSGRLVELGVVDGRDLATIRTTYRVPVDQTAGDEADRIQLRGTQTTTATVSHALDDGAVERVDALTRGRYRLTLLPAPGSEGAPVSGTLSVEVRSSTRRVG